MIHTPSISTLAVILLAWSAISFAADSIAADIDDLQARLSARLEAKIEARMSERLTTHRAPRSDPSLGSNGVLQLGPPPAAPAQLAAGIDRASHAGDLQSRTTEMRTTEMRATEMTCRVGAESAILECSVRPLATRPSLFPVE